MSHRTVLANSYKIKLSKILAEGILKDRVALDLLIHKIWRDHALRTLLAAFLTTRIANHKIIMSFSKTSTVILLIKAHLRRGKWKPWLFHLQTSSFRILVGLLLLIS